MVIKIRLMVLFVLTGLLGACTATPLVEYRKIDAEDKIGVAKFKFADSLIKFDYVKDQHGILTKDLTIASVPTPSGIEKYGITGTGITDNWGVVTTVNVTYRADTDLLQEVSIAVSDKRIETIKTVGSIVAGVAGFLANAPTPSDKLKLPEGIVVSKFLEAIPEGCVSEDKKTQATRDGEIHCSELKLEGTNDYVADISISARPIDSFELSSIKFPLRTKVFLYTACRSATISVKKSSDGQRVGSAQVAVADPKWIQTLAFPPQGKVSVKPSCGANSTSQDANLPNAVDYLNELMTQANAIKKALDSKNTSGASK